MPPAAVEEPRRYGELIVVFRDLATLGVHHRRKHIRQLVAEGKFPAPVRLGVRGIGWRTNEIRDWVARLPTRSYVLRDRMRK